MNKFIIAIFTSLFFTSILNAQLFEEREFYPNLKEIKIKSYGGTSKCKSCWNVLKFDSLGKAIAKEYYKNNELHGRENFIYNSNNDILFKITTFQRNYPDSIMNDTTIRYEYEYQGDRIIYQKKHSYVIRLTENRADTTLIYEGNLYLTRQSGAIDTLVNIYTLDYKNGLLVREEIFRKREYEDRKYITHFEYYPDGRIKRERQEKIPEFEGEKMCMGGTCGDEIFYKYKFDKLGRVRKKYRYIADFLPNGNYKQQVVTYEYY